jgi:CheY-like chemotaxis protein
LKKCRQFVLLVVLDEGLDAHVLEQLLRGLSLARVGLTVLCASDGTEALREVLHGLGFKDDQIDGDVGGLSGGKRKDEVPDEPR